MTRDELIELFQEGLSGGVMTDDTKTKYHPEIIAGYVDLALEQIGSIQASARTPAQEMIFDALTKTYLCVPVQCDKKRKEYYFDIPAEYINLPGNGAIVHVGPDSDVRVTYHMIPLGSVGDISSLEALNYNTYFYLEHMRGVFLNRDSEDPIRISLVPKFREWGDDEEINIPNGQSAVLYETVMDLAMSQKMTPTEKLDNNTPDYP